MSTSAQNYHHGDLRAALLKEGIQLLKQGGPEALTLRKLAQHLGVSHMAPYRHFPDKDALLAAISAEGFRQLRAQLEAAANREAATDTPLLREGLAYVRFALAEPAMFRLMFGAARPAGQFPELDTARSEAFQMLKQQVSTEPYSGEQIAKARGCWALVHGLALLLLDGLLQVPNGVGLDDWLAEILRSTVS